MIPIMIELFIRIIIMNNFIVTIVIGSSKNN